MTGLLLTLNVKNNMCKTKPKPKQTICRQNSHHYYTLTHGSAMSHAEKSSISNLAITVSFHSDTKTMFNYAQ